MLTLTVPHFTLEHASGAVREACAGFGLETTVHARLAALRLAWPKFLRRVRRWLMKKGKLDERRSKYASAEDADHLRFYRLLEWTRGGDGLGHPHFHVYLFAPWLDVELLRRWWAEALESVGVPAPERVIIDLKSLAGFNWAALKELIKTGDRRAIEMRLGQLRTPGDDAIKYASGWTMGDAFRELPDAACIDVQRDLYCALEGRRLAQGSAGFLLATPRPLCACCGQSCFVAAVVDPCVAPVAAGAVEANEVRGPP